MYHSVKAVLTKFANKVLPFTRRPMLTVLTQEVNEHLKQAELCHYQQLKPLVDKQKLEQYAVFLATRSCSVFEGRCIVEPHTGQVLYGTRWQYINNGFHPYELADPFPYVLPNPSSTCLLNAKQIVVPEALYLRDGWHNLYHFYFDVLGQLFLAKKMLPHGIPVIVPADYNKLPFVEEVLQALQLNSLNFLPQTQHKNILVTSKLYLLKDWVINDNTIALLRDAFVSKTSAYKGNKLFVSRMPGSNRSLQNQVEVDGAMSSRGYHIFYAEQYPFLQQVVAFAQATTMVGLHGAGLANMLFMPAGSHVYECIPAGYFQTNLAIHYRRLANHLGLVYETLEGSELDESNQYMLPLSQLKALDKHNMT